MKLLTHNDLDGYGCRLVLEDKYKFESVIHTDYMDITLNLKTIKDVKTSDKTLFITDLNFKKDDIKVLIELLKDNWKIRYFDHHKYTDKELKIFEKLKENYNFKYIIDTSISATKITFNVIKSKNENLKKLVEIIDTYDMWRLESPLWNKAFAINNIFYLVGEKNFYKKVKENNYSIPEEFKKIYKEHLIKKDKYFKNLEKNNKIIPSGDIVLFIMENYEFSTFVTFEYPDYKHYIIVYPFTDRISLRHKNIDEKVMEKKFEKLMKITHPKIKSLGGHLFAQGMSLYKLSSSELSEIINLIGDILNEE